MCFKLIKNLMKQKLFLLILNFAFFLVVQMHTFHKQIKIQIKTIVNLIFHYQNLQLFRYLLINLVKIKFLIQFILQLILLQQKLLISYLLLLNYNKQNIN